jgi:5,10-methylenetetrahydrofolate reductase
LPASDGGVTAGPVIPLREAVSRGFVITVELDPPKGPDLAAIFGQAAALAGKVDAVNIADSPMARMRMSPIALAALIRDRFRIDTIFHLTCRDRNLLGLQSELLGAAALGVRNILCLTGDPPTMGDHPAATGVFDVDAVGLAGIARGLNEGRDMAGNALNGRTDFFIGVAVNPLAADREKEIGRFRKKVEAGGAFTQTQPIFDPETLRPFLDETASLGVPCLAGVLPVKSLKMLEYLEKNVPGIVIPPGVKKRIAGVEPGRVREESIAIAAEIVDGLRGVAAGAHLMPVGDYSMVPEILERLDQGRGRS